MKAIKKIAAFVGCIVGVAAVFYLVLQLVLPQKQDLDPVKKVTAKVERATTKKAKPTLTLTALGDSLTFGVGDTTDKGGYVGLIKTKLEQKQALTVITHNYDKTGDRSDQIKQRVLASKQLQSDLKKADVITMTVGGNDLMKVLQQNFNSLAENKLSNAMPKAKAQYATELQSLLTTVRQYNKTAPIFLISVYNPFYVYFPTLTQIQQYTDEWNEVAKDTIANEAKIYFVDVNKQLSEGQYYGRSKATLQKNATTDLNEVADSKLEQLLSDDKEKNDYLSDEDHFHPNDKGYRYITARLYQVMLKHKSTWLEGEK